MEEKMKRLTIFVIFCLLFTFACQNASSKITANQVIEKMKASGLQVQNEETYNENNDPNKLLNRPNQYIEKINFSDKSIENALDTKGCTIEVFSNESDMLKRKEYTEKISQAGAIFNQYIYSHKTILLRLDHGLIPAEAAKYEKALKEL
jgi:hypothetical protein